MRILTIVGTRPEAIKMAPIIQQLKAFPAQFESLLCATGQHREMLSQMLALFGLVPDIDLALMSQNQSPLQVAARVLQGLEGVLNDLRPDWVLVQGDTTTVMAATIAAHYQRVRVAHVEAGLRTYDRQNPFPEEMNRVVADHVCDLHFAPTSQAKANLLGEGIKPETVFVTGNTVIDALLTVAAQPCPAEIAQLPVPAGDDLILVTAHRRENHGQPLADICAALRQLATRPGLTIIYAVHPNPQVHGPVHQLLGGIPNIHLVPPFAYPAMVHLMKRSKLILTDSGGLQEEAPTLGVPTLVLRQVTERPEAVTAGCVRLVGTDSQRIVAEVSHLLETPAAYRAMSQTVNPYGDGQAAQRIVALLGNGGGFPAGIQEWVPPTFHS